MKLNLPNKLTVARIIATPVFMLFLTWEFAGHYIPALILFIAASLTDMFDGQYARKHNMVTDFGKFLDPLADKMLTTAAFIGFAAKGIGNGIEWILFIVLFREFLISSLRLVAVTSGGKVIAANIWGKLKTVSQMVAIIYTITAQIAIEIFKIDLLTSVLGVVTDIVLWISAILAVISGVIYLFDNKGVINADK
ncbi:MAG: CDP-diacylglycerol--glycerol-3-phosphate 3-phosphatidyltransferase [Ruminococcaceae bacterium]|nr:CDP-diacylglycerol--glycerol-3-phosphate 3-phosphatidyltransferase [Oscillospiraceae bacterium]